MIWKIEGLLEKIGFVSNSVGLALSGGGARGFSHIGVFKAFEEFGVVPSILSGVSAGSIAAAMYGSGMSPKEMAECFIDFNKINDFISWRLPGNSLMKLDKFGKLLESWLPVRNLEDMKIPTIVCATDFEHGKSVGWSKGEIVPRVLASCSIPIIFEPVKIKETYYVDGGVLRNLPAWAIRNYCKTLYGINCSPLSRVWKNPDKQNLIDVTLRSYQMMTKANTLQDINICDHVIHLRGAHAIGTFDVSKMQKTITLGYDTACRVLEKNLRPKPIVD